MLQQVTPSITFEEETEMSRIEEFIEMEDNYGAHNYHPLPIVIEKRDTRKRDSLCTATCHHA